MADYSDLIPANLKPGLTTPDGQDLKPSLVTPLYTGGTPTAADQFKPSLRDAGGNLKPGLVMGDGTLKPSVGVSLGALEAITWDNNTITWDSGSVLFSSEELSE